MKIEQKQLVFVLEAALVSVGFACFYAIGGSGDFWGGQKWIRRFLGPGLFCLWAFTRSGWNWRYLIQMPLMMGASTLPYGADVLWQKWLLRGTFGIVNGSAASLVNLLNKRWLVAGFSIILSVASSIAFGVYNPFEDAMKEQFIIGFLFVIIPALTLNKR